MARYAWRTVTTIAARTPDRGPVCVRRRPHAGIDYPDRTGLQPHTGGRAIHRDRGRLPVEEPRRIRRIEIDGMVPCGERTGGAAGVAGARDAAIAENVHAPAAGRGGHPGARPLGGTEGAAGQELPKLAAAERGAGEKRFAEPARRLGHRSATTRIVFIARPLQAMLPMTARLYRAGIPLAIGTDGIQGLMLDRELELWVQAGIPPEQVLRMATMGAARVGRAAPERGGITAGKLADVALFEGNPVRAGRGDDSGPLTHRCHMWPVVEPRTLAPVAMSRFSAARRRAAAMYSSAVEWAGLEISGACGAAAVTTCCGGTFQNRKRVTTAVMPMKAPAITARGLSNQAP